MDQDPHLAKVRVAGSNPVFRSQVAGQGQFFKPTRSCRIFWTCTACARRRGPGLGAGHYWTRVSAKVHGADAPDRCLAVSSFEEIARQWDTAFRIFDQLHRLRWGEGRRPKRVSAGATIQHTIDPLLEHVDRCCASLTGYNL